MDPNAAITHGLQNKTGENNCFVNSVIQVLWHLDVFRINFQKINFHRPCEEHQKKPDVTVESVESPKASMSEARVGMELDQAENDAEKSSSNGIGNANDLVGPEVEQEIPVAASEVKNQECIVCALAGLFTNFRYTDQSTLPPTYVRKALANVFEEGKMHSVLDCLEEILNMIHKKTLYEFPDDMLRNAYVADDEENSDKLDFESEDVKKYEKKLITYVFSRSILETKFCSCGATSEPFVTSGYYFFLSVAEILTKRENRLRETLGTGMFGSIKRKKIHAGTGTTLFSELIHQCLGQGNFPCPNEETNNVKCKFDNGRILTTLLDAPRTLCLSFNWQSEFAERDEVASLMQTVSEQIDLTKIFDYYPNLARAKDKSVADEGKFYSLMGAICYYGKHYVAYVFHSKLQTWVYCDDAKIKIIGSWKDVVSNCIASKWQVELLVYAAQFQDV